MSREYTRCKTVKFTPGSFDLIETAAADGGVSTSEYIRSAALDALSQGALI